MRTEGSLFSKAAAGFVSPVFRNSSWEYTRLDGSVCVWVVVVAVSLVVVQPERTKPVSATRLKAIEYVFIIL